MGNRRFILAFMLLPAAVFGADRVRPGIRLAPNQAHFLVVEKVLPADCRVVRGFLGIPVDGSVHSWYYGGVVREYPRTSSNGVAYAYNRNDGVHITLADAGGIDAIVLRGGAKVRAYADTTSLIEPSGVRPLWTFYGLDASHTVQLSKRAGAKKISFFGVKEGYISDVSFYRISKDGSAMGTTGVLTPGGAAKLARPASKFAPESIYLAMKERYSEQSHRVLELGEVRGPGSPVKCLKGRAVHLVTRPFDEEKGLDSVSIEAKVSGPGGAYSFTAVVQDPLNPRLDLAWVDFRVSGPGVIRIVLDVPDQVVFKGNRLWLTLRFDTDVILSGPEQGGAKFRLNIIPRQRALGEAVARRKFLLRTFYGLLSEPRPWGGYRELTREEFYASSRYAGKCPELFMTIDQCHALAPADDTIRQYREWVYRRSLSKLSDVSAPPGPPRGVPAWAWYPRLAWLEVRRIADWWLKERVTPTGEFGGRVQDDTDFYQQFTDLPFFESGGVAGRLKESGALLAELADKQNLRQGINRRAMDSLHAYEEGINHMALMARWFYGDPIYLERCMESARNMEKLTILTKDGRRHFRDNTRMGAEDIRRPREPKNDTHANPLMWHTALQLADYNRNPRALKILREWGDTWLKFQKPGKWATGVEVLTGKVIDFHKDRPLSGGYRTQATTFTWLYGLTGNKRYVGPFMYFYREGKAPYPANTFLGDVYTLGGLEGLPGETLVRLAGQSAALALYAKDDADALIKATIGSPGGSSSESSTLYDARRWPDMYTTAQPYTDRVFSGLLERASIAYLGGYCRRNKFNPTLAVSWEGFGTDYAALVHENKRRSLKVLVYSFADKAMTGNMRIWALEHGQYRAAFARDTDGDQKVDRVVERRTVELAKGRAISVTLEPGVVTAIELQQVKKLAPIYGRPDVAIAARAVTIKGSLLSATIYNVGSADAAGVVVAVVDGAGRTVVQKTLGRLAAPLDLVPRHRFVNISLPRGRGKGWRLVLDPQNRIPEIYEGNNTVLLDSVGAAGKTN